MELTTTNSGRWKPGQSGNLNGRPVGSRHQSPGAFLRDLAEVWQEHGKDTMLHTAKTNPTTFFVVCARLILNDVRVAVEQQTAARHLCLRLIYRIGRTLSPLMPDRDQQSDHRDARYRRKDGLKRA
jgi:hypothetical protein